MSNQIESAEQFDIVGFVIAFEAGALDREEVIDGFQHLVDLGVIWSLQGSYQRAAQTLIEDGLISY